MYLNKTKLRTTSGPFDWLTNADFETRINLILNDFKDFLNKEDLKPLQKDPNFINDDNNDYYENTRTSFYFYHDFPVNQDFDLAFEDAKEKYERRIERFLSNLKTKKRILLVWFSTIPHTNDKTLIKLCNSICEKYNKRIDFLIIEQDDTKKQGDIEKKQIAKNITKYSMCTFIFYINNENKHITERLEKYILPILWNYKVKNKLSD